MMLTGNDERPSGFDPNRPTPGDLPSMAAMVAFLARAGDGDRDLPSSVVLPHLLIHRTGRTIPGQLAGRMDSRHDPWILNVAPDCKGGYGACPSCFHFADPTFQHAGPVEFQTPGLNLPQGLTLSRLGRRETLKEERSLKKKEKKRKIN